ncbi:MAG: hypothetical protein EOM85_04380, partial [Candidatus Moranbacteria bacterium]|nr:hypothetical protein [Candidatus Moranbacteria bacterium]
YQVIHQTGDKNFEEVTTRAKFLLENSPDSSKYKAMAFLNNLDTRMAAGCSNLVVSRAGSAIFEIASWGIPSIIIPITNSNGDHQRKNAYNYARSGGCQVLEESNLTANVLMAEIDRIVGNKEKLSKMSQSALSFANHDAALKIARSAIEIGLSHEE